MTFTRETEDDDWSGKITIAGEERELTIRCGYKPDELDGIAENARDYLESNWARINDQIVDRLLPTYNDDWRQDDGPVLTTAEFHQAVHDPLVNIWEEEAIMMYFSDGGIFGGHWIEVFIETPENGREITVGLVG